MGLLDSFWSWLGVRTEVEEHIVELPAGHEHDMKTSNLVSIHSNKNFKVVVCEPDRFDEVQALADHLKNRKQVILNFENTNPEISQKIIDFISGAVYALEGQSQQLGRNIFLFTPSNVEVTRDHRSLMRKGSPSEFFRGER